MRTLFRFLIPLLLLASAAPLWADTAQFEAGLQLLLERSFSKKEQAVPEIAASGDGRAQRVLKALLGSDLYYRRSDNTIVFTKELEDGRSMESVLTGEDLGVATGRREVKRIAINNSMRGQIKAALAELNLANPDPERRLAAVNEMLDNLDADLVAVLDKRRAQEDDEAVLAVIDTALAIAQLQADDTDQRLAAVEQLEGNLHPAVRVGLTEITDDENEPVALRKAADKALGAIEANIQFYGTLETLFFGLSLGSVLVLAAIGLAITFGVMGVINMAHGELIMLGAYTTYVIQLWLPNSIEYSLFIAIPAAFLVSGLVGVLIERGVIRFLYGRALETLLATFGISLILQQLVRSVFSPLNRSVETPQWMSGSWQVNEVLSLTLNRMYIILFCLMVFSLLFFILKKSRLGLQVRAVSQNRAMARAMGVRSEWVDAMTFGLGSGIAGVAGVALSQLTNVGPNLGQAYIIDSFMVVVFGGVGNLWGTLVGGLGLGVANKFLEPWSGAVLAKILVLVFIILFIQKRPKGLFPQKGRAAT
jgi:urea transport system permease protein